MALRCQAVLEALRGRFDTADSLIDRARGQRRASSACAGSWPTSPWPAARSTSWPTNRRPPRLRSGTAHDELAAIGAGAEASQAAALLGRALLRAGHADEVEALVDEAERLAGENLKSAILGRTVRAEWLLATGNVEEARTVAERAVAIAETTDLILDHADACDVLHAAGGTPSTTAAQLRDAKGVAAAGETSTESEAPPQGPPVASSPGPRRGGPVAPAEAWMETAMERMAGAWKDGDQGTFRGLFTAHPALDVARPVGAGSADGDDAFEAMWSLRDLLPQNVMTVDLVSEVGVATGWIRFHDSVGNEVEMRVVAEFDEERLIERLTTFDGDDIAGTRALFEQRVRERGGTFDPVDRLDVVVPELREILRGTPIGQFLGELRRTWHGADDDGLRRLHSHPDITHEYQGLVPNSGRLTGTRVADSVMVTRASFPHVERMEVLALRGTRMAAVHWTSSDDGGNTADTLAVQEVDADGLCIRSVFFEPPDRIMEAMALVDEWYVGSHDAVGREVVSVGSRTLAANHDPSRRDELLHLLPEDVVIRFADELASWGEVSRDDYLTIADTLTAEADHIAYWTVWFEPLSENVAFSVLRRTATMPDGTTPEWMFATAVETLDGQGRIADLFPIELLDRARPRARELNGLSPGSGAPVGARRRDVHRSSRLERGGPVAPPHAGVLQRPRARPECAALPRRCTDRGSATAVPLRVRRP